MTNNIDYKTQREYNYQYLYRFLSKLPLRSYMQNLHLHSAIKRDPLDALIIGRELVSEDYQQRVMPWIIQAIVRSPYLNN